jgi:hypothetical protein
MWRVRRSKSTTLYHPISRRTDVGENLIGLLSPSERLSGPVPAKRTATLRLSLEFTDYAQPMHPFARWRYCALLP